MNTRYLFRYACIAVILALCSGVFAAGTAMSKGAVKINPKDSAEMVWVPAGEFIMGSTDKQIAAVLAMYPEGFPEFVIDIVKSEKPQRKIYLDGYWIYKYEVTVAQYRKFCKAAKRMMPETPDWGWKDNNPIVNVNWQDSVDYAKWAGVTLPTEAQWEKAARGTDGRIYPWGDQWNASKCANRDNSKSKGTKPVGSYPTGASPYGCMDMSGNAWEWCADWLDLDYYKNAPSRNPTGPAHSDTWHARVERGGAWVDSNTYGLFRCANRNRLNPNLGYDWNGFRCVMKP